MEDIYKEINEYIQRNGLKGLHYLRDEFKSDTINDMDLEAGIGSAVHYYYFVETQKGRGNDEVLKEIVENVRTYLENKQDEFNNPSVTQDGGRKKKSKKSKKSKKTKKSKRKTRK